jgi:hypothetical protein
MKSDLHGMSEEFAISKARGRWVFKKRTKSE